MSESNPLGMIQIEPGGPFVLSPMLCTHYRADYFRRVNRILAMYGSLTAYSHFGKDALEHSAGEGQFSDSTPIRINMAGHMMQTTYRRLQESYANAGAQLTNQVFLMIYGNFEAYLFDLVQGGLSQLRIVDAIQESISLLTGVRWKGKIDRVSQKLSVKIPSRKLTNKYIGIEMGFLGRSYSNPIDFLQGMADLRHRLIHSAGHASSKLVSEYPDAGLKEGDLIQLPFGLPYSINFFYVPLTDFLDQAFAKEFSWDRKMTAPESLVD